MKGITVLALIFFCVLAYAQVPATTDDGRKVILNEDGTWEYIDNAEDEEITEEAEKECVCKYQFFINKKDEFSGTANRRLKPVKIATSDRGKRLDAYVGHQQTPESNVYTLYLSFYENLGCMNNSSFAAIKFEDGSMLKLQHEGALDCASPMLFKADVSSHIDTFRRKKITTIRMQGTEYYSDIPLEKSDYFMDAFNCCIFEAFPEE